MSIFSTQPWGNNACRYNGKTVGAQIYDELIRGQTQDVFSNMQVYYLRKGTSMM